MGTRGLTKIYDQDGKLRCANYGQWDHYAEGQGLTGLAFARRLAADPKALALFKEKMSNITLNPDGASAEAISYEEEVDALTEPVGAAWNWRSKMVEDKYPEYSRNTGAKVLDFILDGVEGREITELYDDSDFEFDGLFCEGVVTLGLDTETYEFTDSYNSHSWKFSELPTDEEFVEAYKVEED